MIRSQGLELQEEVLEELALDPRIDAEDIAVTAKDGVVTLRGTVPTLNQKWSAEDAVKRVRQVRGVANELGVDLPIDHVRTDSDIGLAIGHRFSSNAAIPSDVKFVVQNGYVTLTGEVPWYYQAEDAAFEARHVRGVRGVSNLIVVTPGTTLTNDEVKRHIKSGFHRMANLDAKGIEVGVFTGIVTLSGTVHTWQERECAAQAAWSLPGVTSVKNLITVNP